MKTIFTNERFNRKTGPALWLALHAALFLALALCFVCGRGFFVNTNLFDILPESSSMKEVGRADKVLTQRSARQFFVLASSKDYDSAKNAAALLVQQLQAADPQNVFLESVSMEGGSVPLEKIFDYYYQNRFLLLDGDTIQKINSPDGVEELKEEAAQKAFGAFSLSPLEFLEGDPFFLVDIELQRLVDALSKTGTSFSAEYEGDNYVMVRGALTQKGAGVTSKKNGVNLIYDCANKVAARFGQDGVSAGAAHSGQEQVSFIFSGSPFHSQKSAASAQRQVAVISALSMLAVIVLLLLVFKSARPLLYSVGAITLSAAFGFAAELLAFGEIHILTFVFGTTLIGTCLDYSLHFWTRAALAQDQTDGTEVRNKIFKGLSLSFASTELCYLTMLLAPFALLKQISVFCFAGILSAFLTSLLFYPTLALPKNKMTFAGIKEIKVGAAAKKVFVLAAAGTFLALAIFFRGNLRLDNDLRKFYTMSGKLLEDEKLFASVTNRRNGFWYYIVRGQSPEELLQNEEAFCALLKKEADGGNINSYLATSQFVPSKKSKERSLEASAKLMRDAGDLLEIYGYPKNDFAAELREAQELLASGGDLIPEHLQKELGALWLGKIGQEYFSAIFVSGGDAERLKSLAASGADDSAKAKDGPAGAQNVFFINKVSDIAFELNRLTKIMLALLALSFALLMVGLAFFYKPKVLAKIAAVPLLVLLCEAAVIAVFKIPLGFFAVTGIILVFGLGLDYIIYTVESGGDNANSVAVLLSFATTALSFGAIALSSFMPVHIFGTVVFAGLVAAWGAARVLK